MSSETNDLKLEIKMLQSTLLELQSIADECSDHASSFLALLNFLPHIQHDEPFHFLRHWMEGSWEVCHQWDEEIMQYCPELFDDIFGGESK